MRALSIILLIIVIVLLAAGAYYYLVMVPQGGNAAINYGNTAATTTTGGFAPAATYTLDATTSPALGTFLIAANGMTLYSYAIDSSGTTACTSVTCVSIWPPYTVASGTALTASPAVPGSVGTITRPDGSMQVTYNGMPLYFYHGDSAPGDTNGSNVSNAWSVSHP